MNDESVLPATSVRPALELNEKNIKLAQPGDVLRDATVTGLHLRCFPANKTYYLYYRTKAGKERRPKLGAYGSITLAQARKVAQEILAEVALGKDPSKANQDARSEPTVAELWSQYDRYHLVRIKSRKSVQWYWDKLLEPRFGRLKLSEVTYRSVCDFMTATAHTPTNANRALAWLSGMFNFAIAKLKWLDKSPCHGVPTFKEVKRKRYMAREELSKLWDLLVSGEHCSPAVSAFCMLLIFTGARTSEIAAARWDWFDGNALRLPDSKTGAKTVYFPQAAMDVLAKLPRTTDTITGIGAPSKQWNVLRNKAGCPDLRMHDLRHSFASFALASGVSLSQIGELLGHTETQTTKRYAHLIEEVAATAVEQVADRIMAQINA